MGGSRQRSCSFWEMGGVMFANNKYLHNTLHTHLNNQYFCNEKSKSAGLVALPLHQVKFIIEKRLKRYGDLDIGWNSFPRKNYSGGLVNFNTYTGTPHSFWNQWSSKNSSLPPWEEYEQLRAVCALGMFATCYIYIRGDVTIPISTAPFNR